MRHDTLCQIDGDGKANAGVHSLDHCIDGNDFAVQVDQGAAAVAGIDAGIGLEEVLVGVAASHFALK